MWEGTCSWGCPRSGREGGQMAGLFPGLGFQITGLSERAGDSEDRMDLTEKTEAVKDAGCLRGGRVENLKA